MLTTVAVTGIHLSSYGLDFISKDSGDYLQGVDIRTQAYQKGYLLDILEKINEIPISQSQNVSDSSVIIDYRSKFFEEQEKNQELEEQLKLLTEKLNNIKNIIG